MEQVTAKVVSMLPVTYENRVVGEATVSQEFEISGKGKSKIKVAGCKVTNGLIQKNKKARLMRNGQMVFESEGLDTFRHLKKDVTEMRKGTECGMSLIGFNEAFLPEDVIQIIDVIELPGVL